MGLAEIRDDESIAGLCGRFRPSRQDGKAVFGGCDRRGVEVCAVPPFEGEGSKDEAPGLSGLCYFSKMDFLREIWDFPAHHVALGWWLAAALTLWNVLVRLLGWVLVRLSILGRNFREEQLAKRVRNLEYLHGNTNGLIRYLASDLVDIAIDACLNCIAFIFLLVRVIPVDSGAMFGVIAVNISASVVGRAWRIRTMLNDLANYPASVELIKAKIGPRV